MKQATIAEINRALYPRQAQETQLVYSVIEKLAYMGIRAYRRNVGAMEYIKARGQRGLVKYGEAGQSDIYGWIPPYGVHLEIECKLPGKSARSEPTALQLEWLVAANSGGCIALCVTSIEDLVGQLRREFEGRRWLWKKRWEI